MKNIAKTKRVKATNKISNISKEDIKTIIKELENRSFVYEHHKNLDYQDKGKSDELRNICNKLAKGGSHD